ncbi:MAG: hypothetical protein EHM70_02325 [Chloroflexota bacterium]|nr:MAG: hypothetical protein EHM70_02325 [Chloroflexota bacterium]
MMNRPNGRQYFYGIGIMVLVVILGYLAIRPWHVRWGATDEEVAQAMPGDLEHIGWTRAITINAAPEEVWPWLVQWGQGRGGWYSYDWLENLFGFDIHTADRILPEYQNLAIGDPICMSRAFCPSRVTVLEPNRWLSWQATGEDGHPVWTFTFGLFPIDDTRSRLIVRESFDNTFMPPAAVVALEVPDVVMELKALDTVKRLAEGVKFPVLLTPLEILLWFIPLLASLTAAVLFANREDWKAPLALLVASVLVLLPVTFLFPPLWLRLALDLVLLAGLAWVVRLPMKNY